MPVTVAERVAPEGMLLLDRGVETLVGVTVGVAVAWLTGTPHPHRPDAPPAEGTAGPPHGERDAGRPAAS